MKYLKTLVCLVIVLALALSMTVTSYAADATIDTNQSGSMDIYKYDLTRAAADKVWDASAYVSSGVYDDGVINALGSGYAIQGVVFTYLRIADICTYTSTSGDTRTNMVLYGMPMGGETTELLTALGLTYDNAHHNDQDVYYFASDTLITALERNLASNATTTKNALEGYITAHGGVALPETDNYGHTSAAGLPLGLYLVVETSVPENVTCTTDPFLVSLPMTTIDGSAWMYSVTLYPKNNTGSPTLEKTVREAQSSTGKNDGSTDNIADGYAHTASGSDGDVMDYQIISTLPTITSTASQLTTYTFVDTLSQGIAYNRGDVVIEFFRDANCAEKLATWTEADGKFNVAYADAEDGGSTMTISMSDTGLAEINTSENVYGMSGVQRGYSGCTLRITYAATVHSDASVVYGDGANPNDVTLTWKRTNTEYFDTLQDDCHVYVYGIDLTKEFSDGAGNFDNVKFILHNDTDGYFVQAALVDSTYYVTGHTENEADATVFTPVNKHVIVKGVEDDAYSWTETASDKGYTLLKEAVKVVITTAEGGTCDVCHKSLLTASATVNGNAAEMSADGESVNAVAQLTVVNTKGFDLPQTGSNGTWLYTTIGIVVMAGAAAVIFFIVRRKNGHR